MTTNNCFSFQTETETPGTVVKNVLDEPVSVFRNYMTSEPDFSISLYEWLKCTGFKKEISALRKENDVLRRRKLKKGLPAITPSGTFEKRRCTENLNRHSGILCIDIDQKDNPQVRNWEIVREELINSNVAYCGLSASGSGLFLMVPIAHPERHKEHFEAVQAYYWGKCGIKIDSACKDVTRLRGVSYDCNAYFNVHAEVQSTVLSSDSNSNDVDEPHSDFDSDSNHGELERVLNRIRKYNIDITDSYEDWFRIGCVIANVMGEAGRRKFHEISRISSKYSRNQCDKQFSHCLRTRYSFTLGTLFFILTKYWE